MYEILLINWRTMDTEIVQYETYNRGDAIRIALSDHVGYEWIECRRIA
jgi:hypothetical protein